MPTWNKAAAGGITREQVYDEIMDALDDYNTAQADQVATTLNAVQEAAPYDYQVAEATLNANASTALVTHTSGTEIKVYGIEVFGSPGADATVDLWSGAFFSGDFLVNRPAGFVSSPGREVICQTAGGRDLTAYNQGPANSVTVRVYYRKE